MEAIKEYFNKLRHDDKHHLGLGDIRLTIGQQEEIIRLIEEEFKKVYLPHVSKNEVAGCDHCRDEQGFTIGNMYVCDKCGRQVP